MEKDAFIYFIVCYSSLTYIFALSAEIQILQADKNRETIILLFQVSLLHLCCRSQNVPSLFECVHGTKYISHNSHIFCYRFSIS